MLQQTLEVVMLQGLSWVRSVLKFPFIVASDSCLAGGSYQEICLLAGVSHSSFCVYTHWCIFSINNCEALTYKFPTKAEDIKEAA